MGRTRAAGRCHAVEYNYRRSGWLLSEIKGFSDIGGGASLAASLLVSNSVVF
jgi:hypothetical protein